MAVAALLIWLGTAAAGAYLLVTGIQAGRRAPGPAAAPATVAAGPAAVTAAAGPAERSAAAEPSAGPGQPAGRPAGRRRPDPFAPPSLQRAQAEKLPGLRELAEFAHPALAVIGFGCWLGYVVSRDRLFAAIGLGILLGAIAAGVSWFAVNRRSADSGGLRFSPRVLLLHAAGAALTLLLTALIAARV